MLMNVEDLFIEKLEKGVTGVIGIEVGGEGVGGLDEIIKDGEESLCVSSI